MVDADDSRALLSFAIVVLESASNSRSESFGKVAKTTDVNGYVVFFRSTGERKRVVLPYGYFGAAEEYILYGL